jgi:hypothetical protein
MSTIAAPILATAALRATKPGWARRFVTPTLADALFVLLLLRVLYLGSVCLFNDPGTGWHIQTGREILSTGAVPAADTYSFTRAGARWVETQWLADLLMAWMFDQGGYALLAVFTSVIIAGLFRGIYRAQILSGGWPIIAVLVTFLAVTTASLHFLARPLVFSSVCVPLSFWWASQYSRRRCDATRLALLILIAVPWANCHPGVLGGAATVLLCGVGTLVAAFWNRDRAVRGAMAQRGFVLLATAAGMGIATLVTPYGLDWHVWVSGLMRMGALAGYVDEWLPPVWSEPSTLSAAVLVGLLILGVALRRKGITLGEGLVLAFWTVQGFSSVRHLPLLAMIAAIQLGRVLGKAMEPGCPLSAATASGKKHVPLFSPEIRRTEVLRGGGLVSVLATCLLGGFTLAGVQLPFMGLRGAGPSEDRFSEGALQALARVGPGGPIFNDINYGGRIIQDYSYLPVFMDDRFELYGEEFLFQYRDVVKYPDEHAGRILDRWGVGSVIIGTHLRLCEWLTHNEEWVEEYRDEIAAVFTRADRGLTRAAGGP